MDLACLKEIFSTRPAYRLAQAKKVIFQDLIADWQKATTLPKDLRDQLNKDCPLNINAQIFESPDENTVKTLITLKDGLNIEAVLMRHKNRNTVCVSTQVGCALDCGFCATGKMGFKRNLEIFEIIEQILFFARYLKTQNQKITNIVFMGMGEPFLNYENVIGAIRYLNHEETLCLGMRNFSISTSGIPDGIKRFANEHIEVNLALSLHAADNDLRTKLMPINKTYPLEKVLESLDYYQKKTRRKLMFEYIMIKNVNDKVEHAEKLAEIAKNYICTVNLIPCNASPKSQYKSSTPAQIKNFKAILEKEGITVTQRFSRGRGIRAACGQLANVILLLRKS